MTLLFPKLVSAKIIVKLFFGERKGVYSCDFVRQILKVLGHKRLIGTFTVHL